MGGSGDDSERPKAAVVPLRPDSRRRSGKGVAKDARQAKAAGVTLCRRGFHRWVIDKTPQFDVKLGRLVTRRVCERCGEARVAAD